MAIILAERDEMPYMRERLLRTLLTHVYKWKSPVILYLFTYLFILSTQICKDGEISVHWKGKLTYFTVTLQVLLPVLPVSWRVPRRNLCKVYKRREVCVAYFAIFPRYHNIFCIYLSFSSSASRGGRIVTGDELDSLFLRNSSMRWYIGFSLRSLCIKCWYLKGLLRAIVNF